MPRWAKSVVDWCEARLSLREAVLPMLTHPVPGALTRRVGWAYVFGSATLTLFVLQIVTGICLAFVYVPSADKAYDSLLALNDREAMPLGWMIRALHNVAASGMIVMMVIHMTQVFLYGAYKYPREMTWLAGVVLFVLTLGMGFTGQVLRWDADAYWGIGVGASMVGRVPVIGPQLVRLMLGGPTIGGDSLSRFFTLHVFLLPALLIGFLAIHLWLVLKRGISEPPTPGRPVDPKTYDAEYHKELAEQGVPFFPEPLYRDLVFCALTVLVVVGLAAYFGEAGPADPPDPTLIPSNPRPEWFFLPLFALLALCPPEAETPIILILPLVVLGILVALPFIAGKGERAPSRRPVAVLTVVFLYVALGVLGWLGYTAPWSPEMFAWSGTPVPETLVRRLTPLELQGAVVLQNKSCRNCHAIDGSGGKRGPDLSGVATRLTRDELVRQVIQGGGAMPAYGNQLSPAEVEALVAFLQRLRPEGQDVARTPVEPPK